MTVPPCELKEMPDKSPWFDQYAFPGVQGVISGHGMCFMPMVCAVLLGLAPALPHLFKKPRLVISSAGIPGLNTKWLVHSKAGQH
jgi:hypothetical protein